MITTLEQQSYNTSHKIYREAMIKHLKTTNMYDYFVNEQQVEDTKENNEDLIKKYFSDLEALLYHIV